MRHNPQVTYESVEDVHLTDPNSVYFNVGLESESETSEVLSLPGSSEEVRARLASFLTNWNSLAIGREAPQPGQIVGFVAFVTFIGFVAFD